MNLNFIKKKDDLYNADIIGKNILELYEDKEKTDLFYRAFDYDPGKNRISEIAPDIKKYVLISIQCCIYDPDRFYFASYAITGDVVTFSVYEYVFATSETKLIFSFNEDKSILTIAKKIKIFVLNPSNFLIQTESLAPERLPELMGVISFVIRLFNSESDSFLDIEIPDLINNGINTILPLSENRLMIKCGYSFLEDQRIDGLSEKEALIESVYVTSASKFISDLNINTTAGNLDLIDTAYFDKCISGPGVKDDIIFYNKVDTAKKTEDINFINANTLEKYIYHMDLCDNDIDHIPVVIKGTPYILIREKNRERFLNLKTGLEDMEFINEEFICSDGDILIFNKNRHKKEKMRIYSYPGVKLVFEDRLTFCNMTCKNDEYYIYI